MSQFLAPIHTWLFDKILLMESIEKEIVNQYSDSKYQDAHAKLVQKYGDFIPNQPLEQLIDQSNIHGWLQEGITVVENRLAFLITIVRMDIQKEL